MEFWHDLGMVMVEAGVLFIVFSVLTCWVEILEWLRRR